MDTDYEFHYYMLFIEDGVEKPFYQFTCNSDEEIKEIIGELKSMLEEVTQKKFYKDVDLHAPYEIGPKLFFEIRGPFMFNKDKLVEYFALGMAYEKWKNTI